MSMVVHAARNLHGFPGLAVWLGTVHVNTDYLAQELHPIIIT